MSNEIIINSKEYRDMTLTVVNWDKIVQLNLSNAFWTTSEQIRLNKDEAIQLRNFLNEFLDEQNG